jgi:hypothetical protein
MSLFYLGKSWTTEYNVKLWISYIYIYIILSGARDPRHQTQNNNSYYYNNNYNNNNNINNNDNSNSDIQYSTQHLKFIIIRIQTFISIIES